MRLTLASASPRRKQLLEMLGIFADVRPSHIKEVRADGESPVAYVERLARDKARSIPGDLVLGADTPSSWVGPCSRSRWTPPMRCACSVSSRDRRTK